MRAAACVIAAAWLAGCALAGPSPDAGPDEPPPASAEFGGGQPPLPYEVRISGVAEDDLRQLLRESSQLYALRDEPPLTRAGLRRRAEADLERLNRALRSEGFYDAEVEYAITGDSPPLAVELRVRPGVVYLLESFDVRWVGDAPPPDIAAEPSDLDLQVGMRARAPALVAAQNRLLARLGGRGRPLARIEDRRYVVDHERTTLAAEVAVDPGPPATFGEVRFEGLETVEEDYLRRLVPWTAGETFDRDQVETFRDRVSRTNLFRRVSIEPAEAVGPDGRLPVTVEVAERPHRSIGAGLGYSSDRGASVEASWQHRNLFGDQESLELSARLAEFEQTFSADARNPHVGRYGQNLLGNFTARAEESEAFDERSMAAFVGLERPLGGAWGLRAGPSLEYSELTDKDGTRTFNLFGFPASLRRDTTDDPLDPSDGTRFGIAATPYMGTFGRDVSFLTAETTGSAYWAVTDDDGLVLAARYRLGALFGEPRRSVPANKRFYAGGGGSIRGYPFRSVGPLDNEDDPLGGRSVAEIGLEARWKITESIGIVPFLEGGQVYPDPVPEFPTDTRWAVGLGGRYYTAVAPIRVDVAVPLDRRPGIDDGFEFYISIGQAF